eukprot:785-Heterococcus_DN1.PRE.2
MYGIAATSCSVTGDSKSSSGLQWLNRGRNCNTSSHDNTHVSAVSADSDFTGSVVVVVAVQRLFTLYKYAHAIAIAMPVVAARHQLSERCLNDRKWHCSQRSMACTVWWHNLKCEADNTQHAISNDRQSTLSFSTHTLTHNCSGKASDARTLRC